MKKTFSFVMISVCATLLISCTAVFSSLGYVPRADLDAATKQVSDLNTKLTTANTEIEKLKTGNAEKDVKLTDYQSQITEAQSDLTKIKNQLSQSDLTLEDWKSLQCEQDWDMLWYKAIFSWPLTDYSNLPDYFHYYIAVTQWSTDPKWQLDDSKAFSVVLFDRDNDQSMAIDTVNDCVILNPDVFDFLEK